MKTPRLYWDDPLLLSFETQVVDTGMRGDRPALVLRESAFYPEAGGQLADRGEVRWERGGAQVLDAQEDEAGRILHLLPPGTELPAVGEAVRISIEEDRRRAHMSLHTGQHLLSRAILDVAGAATISSRLGETICTIDTPVEKLSDEALADAEALVARVVLEDRPIRAWIPGAAELARLPLRRDPKVAEEIRVVDVDGFDVSPCGGTHCLRTGQVGAVRIVGIERYKGGLRLSFHTGLRTLRDAAAKDRILRDLSGSLTCGIDELSGVVAKLRSDLKEERTAASSLRERLARYVADELLATAEKRGAVRWVFASLPDEPIESLRAIASRIAETPDAVAVLASPAAAGVRLIVQRGGGAGIDAGATLRAIAQAAGGRGGGRPDRAEGQLPAGADLAAAFATVSTEGVPTAR